MLTLAIESHIKQYLPAKPHPYGFKWWVLAARKFVRRIKLFVGKSEEESEDGKMCDLINEMLVDYENNHHILYCDNYFTSWHPSPSPVALQENIHMRQRQPQPTQNRLYLTAESQSEQIIQAL